ncbi:hypothetical protein [Streptomyces californicus]|uniref:hypothetical protein n=1 Tax=Streptomyces californicus TaxID=67351 RepID=UPI003814A5B5
MKVGRWYAVQVGTPPTHRAAHGTNTSLLRLVDVIHTRRGDLQKIGRTGGREWCWCR